MTHDYKKISRSIWVAIGALLLAGCTFQTYSPKPLDPAERMQNYRMRDPNELAFRSYVESQGYLVDQWPIAQWGLKELTLSALYFHPQLDVARAQLQASQAREITAGQPSDPSFSGTIGKSEDDEAPWIYSLGLDVKMQTAGKRELSVLLAQSLSEATRIEIGQAAWVVRSRLLTSWIEYNAALQQANSLQREVEVHREIMDMLNKRLEAGLLSNTELSRARLQLQQAEQRLTLERSRIPELYAALATNAGLSPETLNRFQLATPSPEILAQARQELKLFQDKGALQDAALLNRLDIRAALARYEAAERKLRLEIARQYPDITLSPSHIYEEGFHIWQLGLNALLPLLNKNKGMIAEAHSLREVEAAQFEALQAQVIGNLEQAKARYQSAVEMLEQTRKQYATTEQQLQRMSRQFDQGYADRLELAYSRLENLQAMQNLVAAEYGVQRAAANLEDALQQPLEFIDSLPRDMQRTSQSLMQENNSKQSSLQELPS